jgi:dTDP-4-dehydrorhamnose 3,5-epimerase
VQLRELSIPDAYELTPIVHRDDRGSFTEMYRFDALEAVIGHRFELRQGNLSTSARGAVRGVHYALVPPSQAKFVYAPFGALLDIVVDIRVGSPTFGAWDSVVIDDVERRAVYLAEGLGHVLVALTEGATANYLASEVYNPERELGIDPLDPELGIAYPFERHELLVSPKDLEAPSLADAAAAGRLPDYAECRAFYASLSGKD